MKTYLHYWITFILVMQASFTFATGQSADIIYINGEKWKLFALPLETNSQVHRKIKNTLPEDRSIVTSNWVGYTAYWLLHEDMLYLQQVQVPMYDKKAKRSYTEYLTIDTLKSLFPDYATKFGIEARWFSGQARAGRGKVIRYEHSGFNRNMDQEYIMSFENGKLTNKRLFHNKALQQLDENQLKREVYYAFKSVLEKDEFVKNNYRQIQMANIEFTPEGFLKDCELNLYVYPKDEQTGGNKIQIKDQQHEYIKELKQILKELFVQDRYYINGQYREEEKKYFEFSF